MKCPACWAEKAYVHHAKGWKRVLLACLLLVPMKCHHCYHKFHVFWWATIGEQTAPPALRIAPISRTSRPSYAARHMAAVRTQALRDSVDRDRRERRADAA
jgi:hypothetical protein